MSVGVAAVLFDIDGTLVDSGPAVLAAWRRWADEDGLEPEAVLDGVHGVRSADAPVGVAAARAAGAFMIALTTTRRAEELAEAAVVVANLAALEVTVADDGLLVSVR